MVQKINIFIDINKNTIKTIGYDVGSSDSVSAKVKSIKRLQALFCCLLPLLLGASSAIDVQQRLWITSESASWCGTKNGTKSLL